VASQADRETPVYHGAVAGKAYQWRIRGVSGSCERLESS
jgi:hypothetical protein